LRFHPCQLIFQLLGLGFPFQLALFQIANPML
jgi:hypothetical protein